MAGEEGLVIPTFGIDPEADNRVLPDFDRAKAAAPPPEPDNPGQGFLGNLRGAFRSGTITGALAEAETQRLARGGTPTRSELTGDPVGFGMEGLIAPEPELTDARAAAIKQAARDQILEQVAYDLSPTRVTGAGIAGQVAGQVLDPLNLLTFGGSALAGRLAAAGYGRAAQAAATMGVQAGVTDLGVQGVRTVSGAQEHFEPLEAALAPVAGALLGAGGHAALEGGKAVTGLLKENLKSGVGSVAEFIRTRAAHREALGVDLPREALAGGPAAGEAQSPALPQPAVQTARTAPAEAALRSQEPARGMPAAEPDATAPVSREQADGRAEPPPPAVEQPTTTSPDQTAPTAQAEAFEARSARLSAERRAMQDSGADASPEGRDLYEALGTADSERNADPAWATRHIDEALTVGRADVADHIVEGAERRAVEAERIASEAAAKEAERDTAGTRYATAVAQEDAQQARATADAARRQREATAPSDRGALAERSPNTAAADAAGEARGKFEIVPADHDELGMVKPGNVDDRLYRILRDGEPVGYTNVRVRGDTADVRDIFTHLGGGNVSLSRGVFGPRAMSQIMRQFLAENPSVTRLTGERVSGARRSGGHGLAGTGQQIEVPIPVGRRGLRAEAPPRDLIGQAVPNLGEHRVSVPGQEPIQVAPMVVEASELRTSADAGYDHTLQPRQRDRAASQEQIRDIATNLEPERLGASAEADRGAPIVGGDAQVESGNGRVLAIRRAYAQGGEAADRYRAWLADQGVDVGRYREPVLVRQRLTGLTAEQRRAFTDAANRPATLSMSAPERAMADARLVTPDSLDLIRNPNDLGAASNRDFVRSFVARLPQAERGAMTTAEGGLSAEGAARVRNAVLAKAYEHTGVLSRIAESTTDDVRSISNALVAAAPDWAKLRADIARGAVREDVDLTGELLEAVTRTADLRAKGQKLDTFLDQQDAFGRLPRPVEAFMRMFYDERGRRAASGPVVAERLRGYAGEARKVLADQGLDLGMPAVSADEIQAAAARRGQRAPAGDPALLFSSRPPTDPRQISFFDRVAESLRSAEPGGATKRAGDAADFLRGLGTEMADRAGREGPQPGSMLDRLAADLEAEMQGRPARDPFAALAGSDRPPTLAEEIEAEIRAAQARTAALPPAADESFTAQLARELQTEIDRAQRTLRERPDLLDTAETSIVEAATRLHGTPAERRIPVDELRAAVPSLSTTEFERAVVDLHSRGVARFADGAVSLDHAGVRAAQEAVERHVRTEAESIGRELFEARGRTADDALSDLERALDAGLRDGTAEAPRGAGEMDPVQPRVTPDAEPPTALEARVLRAIEETPDGKGLGKDIWDVRDRLPGVSEPDFVRAMHGLQAKRLTNLSQYSDPRSYRGKVGIDVGAGDRHIVSVQPEGRTALTAGDTPEILQRRRAAAAQTVEEPDQIRQGRPVEDQGTAQIEGDARPARLEEMAQSLASDFETVLRTGRVQPGARGQFNTSTGVARVRSLSDLDTTLHEIGHSVQQSPQTAALVDPVIARNRAELTPLGAGTGATGDAEAFAELFRLYATNRAYAERTYPGATADLERTLRADLPAQADALDRLRAELDTLHRADSGAVVGSDVITPKPDGLFRRMLKLLGTDIGASEADPSGTVFYTWRDALYARMVATQHPIGKAQEALARLYRSNTGETLNLLPQDDAYIRARLASGSRAVADAILARGVRAARGVDNEGPSFRDAVVTAVGKRWTGEQWHDFGAYLTARSMVADYERFAAGEIPNPPGKLSAGDYAKAVQEFEGRYPTFADGAEQLYTFQRNLLQRHFDLGLFTKGYYDAAMARRDYVPKMRDMEDLGQSRLAGSGKRDGASVMKAFRGSQRSVMNPLDAIYARVHELETAAALNETKAALARLAETAGPGSGFIAEPVPANKLSSVRVDVVDALRAAGSRANVDNLDLGALIQQAEGLLGDDVFSHIFRQEPIRPGAEPITFYYVNGERRALRLADGQFGQALYNALNTVTEPERNVFVSVLQIGQQMLRSGVTKSLGFIYRNPVRDQFTSTATGARNYIPFVSAFQGLYDIASHGGDFERYLSHGGFAGGAIHEAIEGSALKPGGPQSFRAKAWWDPRRPLGAAAQAAELSEAATRAGLFQSYTKQAQGLGYDAFNTALYATYNANDYIDFRRTGSDLAVVRRFVPFLGATIQGTDKEARSLIGDMVRLEGKRFRGEELSIAENDKLQTARAAWVKTLGVGLVMGGGTAYLNAQDPEWFGAAAWRRHRAYNITPAGPEGNWFDMPKPFGLVRNVSDTFEYGVEYLFRQDPTLLKKWGEALADAHTVPYTNPFIDVFYNARANYDAFRDRPIVPPSLQSLPPSEQYTRYTSEIAKAIGQVTGWSPMKTDYVAKSLGGGTVIDWLRNSDTLIRWMQGKPGGKEKTIWDLPLARELVQNLAVGSEATTRFYGLVGQKVGSLEQAATAYGQKIATGDRTGAESYLRNLPENERAYAVLMKTTFDAEDRLMHPLALARAYNAVIGGVSKALGDGNLLPEGDLDRQHITLSQREGQPIRTDGPTTEKLRNALDALSMVTARNALIAYGADGMQGVPVKDPAEFLDRIRMLSPDVARELRGRLAAKRLYDPATVAERWPEVKARLLKDGEGAEFNDLLPHRARSAKRERKRALQDD